MKLTLLLISLFVAGLQAAPQAIVPHIVNGQRQRVQHACAIFAQTNADGSGVFGAGSIISARHILTGANVVFGASRVRVGYGSDELATLTGVDTTTFVIHSGFNRATMEHDIAIVFLSSANAIDLDTDTVRPIALPSAAPVLGDFGSIAGFGYTESNGAEFSPFLLVANVTVVDNAKCVERFPGFEFTTSFCIEGAASPAIPSLPSNACAGDNGAGFYTGDGFIPTTTTTPEPVTTEEVTTDEVTTEEVTTEEVTETILPFGFEDEEGQNGPPEYWDGSLESEVILAEGEDESPTEGEIEPELIGVLSMVGNWWVCIPTDVRSVTLVVDYVEWIRDFTGIA